MTDCKRLASERTGVPGAAVFVECGCADCIKDQQRIDRVLEAICVVRGVHTGICQTCDVMAQDDNQ